MNPRVEARLEQVKRTSRSARRACFWLMVLIPLMAIVMALSTVGLPESLTCDVDGMRRPCSDLPPQVLAFAYVALLGVVALVLAVLHRFARLFGNYARGEIFTRASVRELRLVGYLAVAYAVFQGVLFIAALALAAGGAVESPASLRADLPFGPILVAGCILLLSWVMDVGAELREENELTV
jgi:Protein of unknown function (DUF2975)